VIQAVNDAPATKVNTIQRMVDQTGVNGKLNVTVKRNDRLVALSIAPEQMPTIEPQ
jgi:hypothetical protein